MQTEKPTFAKTVVNVSYVSRKGSGTCAVKQIPSANFQTDTSSSLKVKQHLNQLAREEARLERHSRQRPLPQRPVSAEPYLRVLGQNPDSENVLEGVLSFTNESHSEPNLVKPNLVKPRVLKAGVISNCDVSLSQVLGTELFSSGSIPSNKEIDRVLEVIKAFRQRSCSTPESNAVLKEELTRRHSDNTDLRSCSKRSIKDSPSRLSSIRPSLGSLKPSGQFKSTQSAFKCVSPNKNRLQSTQTIPEEMLEDTPCSSENEEQRVLSPVIISQSFREKTSRPASIVVSINEDPPECPWKLSPEIPLSFSDISVSLKPPDIPKLQTRRSPENSHNQSPPMPPSSSKRREPFSGGFSVRNPTATSFQASTEASLPTPFSTFKCELEDFVPHHSLSRRNRPRYRRCSQPCMPSNAPNEDEGVEKLPSPRYSPHTHPRAKLPSHLAACSGNHPPVSYLNSFGRSRSLQVNHIALHEFRNLQIKNENRIKSLDRRPEVQNEEPDLIDDDASQPLLDEAHDADVAGSTNNEITGQTSLEQPENSESYLKETADSQPDSRTEGSGAPCPDFDHIRNAFKRIGRKYLTDQCVKSNAHPEIETKNSLSFVFSGNQELQEKVRTFFQQTNKSYCKRLIRQRFASNQSDCTSDTSAIERNGAEPEDRNLSEYVEIINAHMIEEASSNVTESIQSVLLKSEGFLSNKCEKMYNRDKLKKPDNFFKLDNLTNSLIPNPQDKSSLSEKLHSTPIQNHTAQLLLSRSKLDSNISDCTEPIHERNGSKTSRDSGYGDSTSASSEILDPLSQRTRSASLTLMSKLKPLLGLKKELNVEPAQNNPFNRIFDDHPISELTKSVDNFIARRVSLPNPPRSHSPRNSPYNEDRPVFDSPPDLRKPNFSSAPSHPELTAVADMSQLAVSSSVTSPNYQRTEDQLRIPTEENDTYFSIIRKSLEDLCLEYNSTDSAARSTNSGHFSLQDIQEILDSFDVLRLQVPTEGNDFQEVQDILQSKMTIALSSIYDSLINSKIPANTTQHMSKPILDEMLDYLDERLEVEEDNSDILELVGLLETFEEFIDLHDEIISRRYYENETLPELKSPTVVSEKGSEVESANHSIYRMVGIHKNKGEPLGITLKKEDDKVVVHRILQGGMIDRQRLLHIGDVIISVNGEDVPPKPDMIQVALRDQEGYIHLKIIPSYREQAPMCQVFVKAHFNYDPKSDNLIPCKEAGLKFSEGDILQIVNQDDSKWWQAKLEGGEGQAGLIPGLILQEQRMAGIKNSVHNNSSVGCGGAKGRRRKKRNKKMNYSANKNADFDSHELVLYEEVAKMPPFNRKTLVMIGAQGVGRRSLITKLVQNEPDKFGNTMPHTSRPNRPGEHDGRGYWFTTREKMDEDITNHKYLEYGEYEGHLYGTKLDSIRQVMRSGKMCLLDVNAQSLKVLKTSEFVPYIVFIEAPPFETLVKMHRESSQDSPKKAFSENDLKKALDESKQIKRQYSHYFDVIIQNSDMEATYTRLYECISKLSTSPQWVPVSWVY